MLYAYKEKVDQYFNDNWITTPIQYDGIRFDKPSDGIWISVQLVPYARESDTFGGGGNFNRGLVKVFAYSTSVTLSFQLAQSLQVFLDEVSIDEAFINIGVPDGNGAIHLQDGVYETLTNFEINLTEGC